MPKDVDHDQRRAELADAACRVVAANGLAGASLRHVADEAGWSVGSIRHYFTTKAELVEFALWRAGDRIEDRIRNLPPRSSAVAALRGVIRELLPIDSARREETLVWLAFVAGSVADADLAPAAAQVWSRLHAPFAELLGAAASAGELASVDVEQEATLLHALVDGLCVQLVSAPGQLPAELALAVVDNQLDALISG